MFRQVFLCVWKRRSRPEEERRRQGRSGASAPHRTAPSARRRVNSGNTSHLGSRSAWLLGGRRTVRDDRAGTSAHRRPAGGSGKRSDSLSRSLTGRRMPNAALSRACANYGCKAPDWRCRARGPSGLRQAATGRDRRTCPQGGGGRNPRQRNRNGPRRSRSRHARACRGLRRRRQSSAGPRLLARRAAGSRAGGAIKNARPGRSPSRWKSPAHHGRSA